MSRTTKLKHTVSQNTSRASSSITARMAVHRVACSAVWIVTLRRYTQSPAVRDHEGQSQVGRQRQCGTASEAALGSSHSLSFLAPFVLLATGQAALVEAISRDTCVAQQQQNFRPSARAPPWVHKLCAAANSQEACDAIVSLLICKSWLSACRPRRSAASPQLQHAAIIAAGVPCEGAHP